jgi:hypothetical protein
LRLCRLLDFRLGLRRFRLSLLGGLRLLLPGRVDEQPVILLRRRLEVDDLRLIPRATSAAIIAERKACALAAQAVDTCGSNSSTGMRFCEFVSTKSLRHLEYALRASFPSAGGAQNIAKASKYENMVTPFHKLDDFEDDTIHPKRKALC